jgi:hypothetical protein
LSSRKAQELPLERPGLVLSLHQEPGEHKLVGREDARDLEFDLGTHSREIGLTRPRGTRVALLARHPTTLAAWMTSTAHVVGSCST